MLLNIFLLVSALCLDTFVASIAYGVNQISLTRLQIAVINGICSLCLCISLLFGTFIDSLIPESFTKEICFFSMLALGCFKLIHAAVHPCACSGPAEKKEERIPFLSWREVVFFSFAMSLDSLAAGTMAAFLKISVPLTTASAFLMGELFTYAGLWIGNRLSRHFPMVLSWVGGILFLILAVLKR